jgi:CRP-like cAMP-binding protein
MMAFPRGGAAEADPMRTAKSSSRKPKALPGKPKARRRFDVDAYLKSTGPTSKIVEYPPGSVVFSQGDPCTDVCYLQKGAVKLSVLSHLGKEAVVAMLAPGDFFGEGALAGQSVRIGTATAVVTSNVLVIEKEAIVGLLHEQPAFADRFLSYMLGRNVRIEADLVDQLFNSSEKRLARTLLLLARYGETHPQRTLPRISQETLAEMIGATRSRVNFFMNKFRKLGLIEYNGGLKVNSSLLSVVLRD